VFLGLLRKLYGDLPQLCVEGMVEGGGGTGRMGSTGEVWGADESDPYLGCNLDESQNTTSVWVTGWRSFF
jgi:hypothetical protein